MGLMRFPAIDERYDSDKHDQERTEETGDKSKWGRVAEVWETGYGFVNQKEVLRRARVVVWVEPLSEAAREGRSGQTNHAT